MTMAPANQCHLRRISDNGKSDKNNIGVTLKSDTKTINAVNKAGYFFI